MSQHKFGTKFCILELFAAEIQVILFINPYNFFCNLSLISHVFMNIHEYTNETICISDSPEKV